jgi:hypothetical protein
MILNQTMYLFSKSVKLSKIEYSRSKLLFSTEFHVFILKIHQNVKYSRKDCQGILKALTMKLMITQ